MELPKLQNRDANSHKGTYGRILIIGGSRGMTGAACLAGSAALRSGAGLVTVAVPDRCLEVVAAYEPNYMTVPLPDTDLGTFTNGAVDRAIDLADASNCVGIGPGLFQSDAISQLVATVFEHATVPVVVDADALNSIARLPDGIPSPAGPRVMTPHIGEFRRLTGNEAASPDDCRELAPEFAAKHGIVLVLKGHRSIITDGTTTVENQTGNPGMATGGSGDVLTGVISGLLGQGLSAFDAAVLGAHVHGLAGDLARDQYGEVSLVAENIKDSLSLAFRKVNGNSQG